MGKLRVLRLAGRFVSAHIASQGDDGVAGVEQLVDLDAEPVLLADAEREHAIEHGLGADIGIAVGVREVVCFVPDDVVMDASQHAGDIALGERVVDPLRDLHDWLGHRSLPVWLSCPYAED